MPRKKKEPTEEFFPGEEKAELFKQRPIDEPVTIDELKELFPDPGLPKPEPSGPEETASPEEEEGQRPMLEKFTETSVLKCILTEAELRHCAEEMARIMGELTESEAELKSVSAQYKATIAKHEQHISEEAAKYRAGHEFRHVQVIVWFDYETGRVWKVREDTGETIEDRTMTSKEAQRKIWPEL